MPQGRRNRVLQGLRVGQLKVLVATDVAARGIDVPTITHVINFGLPMKPEDYVHRIGRTGRAGRNGLAITLAERRDVGMIRRIERFTTQPIAHSQVPGCESKLPPPSATPPARGPARPGSRFGGNFGGGGFGAGRPSHGRPQGGESFGHAKRGNDGFAGHAPQSRDARDGFQPQRPQGGDFAAADRRPGPRPAGRPSFGGPRRSNGNSPR